MIERIAALTLFMALAACDPPASAEKDVYGKMRAGAVAKVAEAPDGTILWGVKSAGDFVYFSASGAHWSTTQTCGKNCVHTVRHDVPGMTP